MHTSSLTARHQPSTSLTRLPIQVLMGICCFAALAIPARASDRGILTLAQLRAEPDLTPERFIKHFSTFKFELGRQVRSAETFLAQEAGDCDDFAALAAQMLRERGYSTRLVAVFMPDAVHVVCYVTEAKCYLDYNCRQEASPLIECSGGLSAIAARVAQSFRCQWRSVSEFTCKNGVRNFVNTEFR